jgi:3-hydroxyisobutyrate dehydrogenase-like beta-hydroxyacid dehydrogenase
MAGNGIERVGFIGLGAMGRRMAATLRRAGFELIVWNRTRSVAEAFAAEHGALVADTPAQLGTRVDVVVSMVADGDAVAAVLTGPDGVAAGAPLGLFCVDCSTIGPTAARRIAGALAEQEIAFVDAPVSGSLPAAEAGTLTIMAGGSDEDVQRAWPVLAAMGELIVHVGALGQGQLVKVITNAMAAANAVTVGESLLLAKRGGVDLEAFQRVVPGTSGASRMLDQKATPMRKHDYTPLFKLELMLKDVRLCLEEAQANGIPFGSAALARQWLVAGKGRGLGEQDYAAVIEPLQGAAGEIL